MDSVEWYKLLFRIGAGVGFLLSAFQMYKLRHAMSVRRQLQFLVLVSSLLVSFRAIAPPYPLKDERPFGLPLVLFFTADTATTASLYCVALVFVRFLVVTAASPGGDHWFSREMMFHDSVFAVTFGVTWFSCLGIIFPVVFGPEKHAHFWVGALTLMLAIVSIVITIEVHQRRRAVERALPFQDADDAATKVQERSASNQFVLLDVFAGSFRTLCKYMEIVCSLIFVAEVAAAAVEMVANETVPLARPMPTQQTGTDLWLLQSYNSWSQILIIISFNVLTLSWRADGPFIREAGDPSRFEAGFMTVDSGEHAPYHAFTTRPIAGGVGGGGGASAPTALAGHHHKSPLMHNVTRYRDSVLSNGSMSEGRSLPHITTQLKSPVGSDVGSSAPINTGSGPRSHLSNNGNSGAANERAFPDVLASRSVKPATPKAGGANGNSNIAGAAWAGAPLLLGGANSAAAGGLLRSGSGSRPVHESSAYPRLTDNSHNNDGGENSDDEEEERLQQQARANGDSEHGEFDTAANEERQRAFFASVTAAQKARSNSNAGASSGANARGNINTGLQTSQSGLGLRSPLLHGNAFGSLSPGAAARRLPPIRHMSHSYEEASSVPNRGAAAAGGN